MNIALHPLSDFLTEYKEKNVYGDYKPVAVGRYGIRKREEIYSKELAKDYTKNKLIFRDTLTIGMGSKQIDIGILSTDDTYSVSPAYHTFRIAGINTDYLRYCLETRNADMSNRFMIVSARQGKSVDIKRWLQYQIPICDSKMQLEIVRTLDMVSHAIDILNGKHEQLERLVQSHFLEMFGDPVDNEMGWNTCPLKSACVSIVDCPHSTPSYTNENTGYMCIRTSIVKKNHILWDEIEYIPEEEFFQRIKRRKPQKGDVVYTREGGILGIAAIIDKNCDVALGQRSMLLTADESICLPEFLSVAMNFDTFLHKVVTGASGSASPHINVGDIRAYNIMMPPIELQQTFAEFYNDVETAKSAVEKCLNKAELLKSALMQQYFG